MARTIAISSQKGGVGKTTAAANLAVAWGGAGARVLLVDLDPQFALTRAFGVAPSAAPATSFDVLRGDEEVSQAVVAEVAADVDLVASHRDLAKLELTLAGETMREQFLGRALEPSLGRYDVVLIDCPPNFGLLAVNALFAAREVVVPVSMLDAGALQGAAELAATVRVLAARGVDVHIDAVVRTLAAPRRVIYRAVNEGLARLGVPVAASQIPSVPTSTTLCSRVARSLHSRPRARVPVRTPGSRTSLSSGCNGLRWRSSDGCRSSPPAAVVIDGPLRSTSPAPDGEGASAAADAGYEIASEGATGIHMTPVSPDRADSVSLAQERVKAVFARVPASLARRLEGAVFELRASRPKLTQQDVLAALLWRYVAHDAAAKLDELAAVVADYDAARGR